MSYLQSTKFTNFCGHPHSIPRGGVQSTYHMGGRPADLAGQEEAQGSGLHVTGWPASQPHVRHPLSQRKQPGNCKWEAGMGGFAQQQKAGAGPGSSLFQRPGSRGLFVSESRRQSCSRIVYNIFLKITHQDLGFFFAPSFVGHTLFFLTSCIFVVASTSFILAKVQLSKNSLQFLSLHKLEHRCKLKKEKCTRRR